MISFNRFDDAYKLAHDAVSIIEKKYPVLSEKIPAKFDEFNCDLSTIECVAASAARHSAIRVAVSTILKGVLELAKDGDGLEAAQARTFLRVVHKAFDKSFQDTTTPRDIAFMVSGGPIRVVVEVLGALGDAYDETREKTVH